MTTKTTSAGWQPGQSGNPKGRPPGTGEVAKMRIALAEHIPQIIDSLVARAVAGDTGAARLILERYMPALKPIELAQSVPIPPEGLAEQGRAVVASIASGDLAVGQGASLLSAIGSLARVVEVDELIRRLETLEAHHAKEA